MVQIGSTILRSECITARSVDSAAAGVVPCDRERRRQACRRAQECPLQRHRDAPSVAWSRERLAREPDSMGSPESRPQ